MPTAQVYHQTASAAGAGNISACSGKTNIGTQAKNSLCTVGGSSGGAVTVGGSQLDIGTGRACVYMEMVPEAGATWAAGDYVVRMNVTTANSLVTWTDTYICRLNSSNVSQATIGSLTGQSTSLSATGVKTHTVSGASQTPSAGDKVYIVIVVSVVTSNNQSFGITWNQDITTPITVPSVYTLDCAAGGYTLSGAAADLIPPVGASYAAALDTTLDINVSTGNVKKRLRVAISNTGGSAGASAFKLRCSRNGGAYFDVTASSTYVKTFDTIYYADGDDVPQLIDSGTYQSDNNAAEDNTGAFTLTAGLAASTKFEAEIALEFIKDDLADNDSLDFRVTQSDNTALDTYTNTGNITITKAGAYEILCAAGSYALSGATADVLTARKLDAAAGDYALSGAAALTAKGYFIDLAAGGYALSGANADILAARKLDAAGGGYTLSGADALTVAGRIIAAAAGGYALTGADALLAKGYAFDVAAGGYTLSGGNADLLAARVLDSAAGSYAIGGADADLLAGRVLNADAGGYVISGADALVVAQRMIDAGAGSYLITGADADKVATYVLSAEPGAYVLTGADALLVWSAAGLNNYEFDVDAGVFELTGATSLLVAGRMLDAEAGSFLVAGQTALLIADRIIETDAGTYQISGQDALVIAGRALNAEAGLYVLTGADADRFITYCLNAEAGAFVITGADAELVPPGGALTISDGDEVEVIQAGGIECMVVTDSQTGVRVVVTSTKQVTVLTDHTTQVKVTI